MNILHEHDSLQAIIEKRKDQLFDIKIALLGSDPSRLADLFPEFIPPPDNKTIDQALDSDSPITVETTVDANEALSILAKMGGVEGIEGELDLDTIAQHEDPMDW